ncbi:hypothetical protein SAMN05660297_03203 [Natronincola peptidivorans]|uniref:Uncharacterized protein n=1 Tax=Natronincola peptidivorans TaxID=426128 RepID=A0A1I0GH06_9FIRM|nr:hypothetical protein [Natronincola peptidivorans]SET70295.1 hypothetical protein SAMN05660297_03203 [Natronincola peptidivorans]
MTLVSKDYTSPVAKSIAKPKPKPTPCPQLPGTVLRIFIPAGAVINLLNIIEVTSPSGICLIVRLPFLAGRKGISPIYNDLVNAVQAAGGKVEFAQE